MSRVVCIAIVVVCLAAQDAFADRNHLLAIEYCNWIEANVKLLNDAIPDESSLGKEWKNGRIQLGAVRSYRATTENSRWTSLGGTYTVKAEYVGASAESIELRLSDGKLVRSRIDKLDRRSTLKLYDILDRQRELVLLAYSLYGYMTAAGGPEDPRWRFLNPLPEDPPEPSLNEPDFARFRNQRWITVEGDEFTGEIRSKKKATTDHDSFYLFELEHGGERKVWHDTLDQPSRDLAELHLRLKVISTPVLRSYKAWLTELEENTSEFKRAKQDAKWKLSDEFALSLEARAKTRRWIDAQPLRDRTRYRLAFQMLEVVGELYCDRDFDGLKDRLNNPQWDFLLMRMSKTKSWKGDVEELLLYSSAGKIYVRDADGEGNHLRLADVWQTSAEIALPKR